MRDGPGSAVALPAEVASVRVASSVCGGGRLLVGDDRWLVDRRGERILGEVQHAVHE
jgi:hypothetical protein